MDSEELRTSAAVALRDLNHAFVAHEPDDKQLIEIAGIAETLTEKLNTSAVRDRMVLIRRGGEGRIMSGAGFEDRAVGGHSNPTSVGFTIRYEGDDVVADVVLRKAFEGAPGRAHGGIVAATFDDVTGFVIGQLQAPAFTGELTVRYLAPVPVEQPLEVRARLDGRERRKLFISAECRHEGTVIASCKAIYITVDPSRFAGAPDPR
jgi:acyl-coenzyme A thioesterase PaaI-like protein